MCDPRVPCASPDETPELYETLGFTVTYRQAKPYVDRDELRALDALERMQR
jgi:hypothetical protein